MSETEPRVWKRWLLPAGLVVAVAAMATIALTRGPADLNPDSPEGTVQEYLVALDEERWADAIEVIHPQWRGDCTADDIDDFAPGEFTAELGHDDEVGGMGAVTSGEVFPGQDLPAADTSVDVTIRRGSVGPLGSGWSEWVVFELVDEDDFWWIAGDPWPYFIWSCQV